MSLDAKLPRGLPIAFGLAAVIVAGCTSSAFAPNLPDKPSSFEHELVTLLPKDAIPAIDDPEFYSREKANLEYEDDELVIGVIFDDEARAYSIDLLSQHEIVNDTVRGRPIAVTW
jgi:hypothetical protein